MEDYAKAYTEVYYAINNFSDELKSKVPKEFINFISNKMDLKYTPVDSEISEEAKAILSVVYSEYLCTSEEKHAWDELDNLFKKQDELSKREVVRFNKEEKEINEDKELMVCKEKSWISSFFEKIRIFFRMLWRN